MRKRYWTSGELPCRSVGLSCKPQQAARTVARRGTNLGEVDHPAAVHVRGTRAFVTEFTSHRVQAFPLSAGAPSLKSFILARASERYEQCPGARRLLEAKADGGLRQMLVCLE